MANINKIIDYAAFPSYTLPDCSVISDKMRFLIINEMLVAVPPTCYLPYLNCQCLHKYNKRWSAIDVVSDTLMSHHIFPEFRLYQEFDDRNCPIKWCTISHHSMVYTQFTHISGVLRNIVARSNLHMHTLGNSSLCCNMLPNLCSCLKNSS